MSPKKQEDRGTRGAGQPEKSRSKPAEPGVFECRLCGKVFEARRRFPTCPECDSADVEKLG
jgi:hypothetical protein